MLNETIQEVELDLMENVIKKINKGSALFEIAEETGERIVDWQTERLLDMGALTSENIQIIARSTGKQSKEIEQLFREAARDQLGKTEPYFEQAVDAGVIEKAVTSVTGSPMLNGIVVQYTLAAQDDFNGLNNSLLASADNMYRDIVNKVTAKVTSGAATPRKALEQLVREWGQGGLTGFIDKAGRNWGADTYGEMIIRSNSKQMAVDLQFQRNNEYGNDYIEVSSKVDARPKCAKDQGKVYSISGRAGSIVDGDGNRIPVYAFSSTSYGEADGLFGINCGHYQIPFFPSFSTIAAQDFNPETVTENYKEKEQQRYIERNIRKYKREALLQKQAGNKDGAKQANQNVRNWQATQREFIKKTGRTRRPAREQLVGGREYQDTLSQVRPPKQ